MQLKRCIVSCFASVKRKTTRWWKKKQQLSRQKSTLAPGSDERSHQAHRMQQRKQQTNEQILAEMRDHSRPQTATEQCEQTEQRSEHCDEEHGSHSFIRMR